MRKKREREESSPHQTHEAVSLMAQAGFCVTATVFVVIVFALFFGGFFWVGGWGGGVNFKGSGRLCPVAPIILPLVLIAPLPGIQM